MARIALHIVALAAFSAFASSGLKARLLSQRISGTHRICVYENPGIHAPPRSASRAATGQELQVGLGEPCPQRRPPTPVQRPSGIPAAATLVAVERGASGTVCRYTFLGIIYSRPIPTGRICPDVAGAPDAVR